MAEVRMVDGVEYWVSPVLAHSITRGDKIIDSFDSMVTVLETSQVGDRVLLGGELKGGGYVHLPAVGQNTRVMRIVGSRS